MKRTNFLIIFTAAAVIFPAAAARAAVCPWEDGGKTYYQNVQDSIKSGLSEKHIDALHQCCESGPSFCNENATDENGFYNVQLSAKYNRTNTLKYFLKYRGCGATVDHFRVLNAGEILGEPDKYNALFYAILNRNKEMIEWLLYYHASPTVKNYLGKDAKYYAEHLDHEKDAEIIKIIKKAWNSAMGYSQSSIEKQKDDLIKNLSGGNLQESLKSFKARYGGSFS